MFPSVISSIFESWNLVIYALAYFYCFIVYSCEERYLLADHLDKTVRFHQLFRIQPSSSIWCACECQREVYCESFAYDSVLEECIGFSGKCVDHYAILTVSSKYYKRKRNDQCDPCWDYFFGHCYYFSNFTTNRFSSSEHCSALNAELAIITSKSEQNQLAYLAKDRVIYGSDGFWIDAFNNGNWIWNTTGENIAYTSWGPGEPNNQGGNEICVEMFKRYNFQWNDGPCDSGSRQFVCEKE